MTFAERCKRYGLSQANVDDLVQRGVSTYGQLLFRVASGPSQVDDGKLNDLIAACTPNLNEAGKSALKRLVFEAGTFVVAELKDTISSPVKRLTPQERDSRFNAVQAKLGSFSLSGPYEPAHSLIDSCSSMAAAQCITYISPSRCASREQEIASGKKGGTPFEVGACSPPPCHQTPANQGGHQFRAQGFPGFNEERSGP